MQTALVRSAKPRAQAGPARSRYVAPSEWTTVPIAALLAGTPRDNLEPKQLSFLSKGEAQAQDRRLETLYVAGDVSLSRERAVAVIGARKASVNGRKRARQLARQLAEAGVVVVSGLAEGVDTEALTAALEAGGRVIAVIGTPLDQAYPAANARLQEEIARDHLLISQFAPGTRVFPSNFPARNRTMAALSDASIVMEASDTSGTLHQAAECVRLKRWLGIAQSVLHDPNLTWPSKFTSYDKFLELVSTDRLLSEMYGGL